MDSAKLLDLRGIIELFGEAGSGKSQFCHYLSAAFVTKHVDRKVLYISLDGRYRCERFFEYLTRLDPNSIIPLGDNVLIHEEFDAGNLHAFLIGRLAETCGVNNIGLVIIDSLAAVFRLAEQSVDKFFLFDIMKVLRDTMLTLETSVIIVNQVSARIDFDANLGVTEYQNLPFKPALGLQWSNCVDHRFLISKGKTDEKVSTCTCLRSPLLAHGTTFKLKLEAN